MGKLVGTLSPGVKLVTGFYDVVGVVGVQSQGLNSKLLRRADLRSTGP